MAKEIILKKLDQMKKFLTALEKLISADFVVFAKDSTVISAAERNFQLMVDLASDINAQILIDEGKETPDTYRRSFVDLGRAGIIDNELAGKLAPSASLRNILVHEYDLEEDYKKFYDSANGLIPAYWEYIKRIYDYIRSQ